MNINDLSPIKQRFYMVFKSTGKTQSEFGRILGKSPNLISSILNNKRNVSGDMIQLLRYKLNVNPNFILEGRRPMFIEKFDINRRIPVIADIPAGPWRYWYDSYAAGSGDDYLVCPDLKGTNLFAIRVDGDSMEPELKKGDVLIINPNLEFSHGIAVVRHFKGYKIRIVSKKTAKNYLLTPLNNKYPEELIIVDKETRFYVPVKIISMRDI